MLAIDDLEPTSSLTCPNCGSDNVVVETRDGYYHVAQCKKCDYKFDGDYFVY